MRLSWAIIAGLLLGCSVAWWLNRESPDQIAAKHERAMRAAAENAYVSSPILYRWRDANGHLQVTDKPPHGRKYQRVDSEPQPGIEVRGDRGAGTQP